MKKNVDYTQILSERVRRKNKINEIKDQSSETILKSMKLGIFMEYINENQITLGLKELEKSKIYEELKKNFSRSRTTKEEEIVTKYNQARYTKTKLPQEESIQANAIIARSNVSKRRRNALTKLISGEYTNIREWYTNKLEKDVKDLQRKLLTVPVLDVERKNIKMHYVRYADDWCLCIRGPSHIGPEIKDKIKTFK
jgi:hypothetical protein